MKVLPMPSRAVGLVAASLFGGILLGLPGSTQESSGPSVPVAPSRIVGAAALPTPPISTEVRRAEGGIGIQVRADAHAAERPGVAGMVIGVDPETGKLGMPTREQLLELSDLERRRLDHSSAGLIEVHHPDGSVSVDLQGRFQEFATVRVGPDGKLIFQCVDGVESAERALQGAIPGPAGAAPIRGTAGPARPESEER